MSEALESLVLPVGIEPTTSPLPRECSTTELRQRPVCDQSRGRPQAVHDAPTIGKAGGSSPAGTAPRRDVCRSACPIVESRLTLDRIDALPLHRRMNDDIHRAPRKSGERAAREERLARALRDNLRRRKEQARAQEKLGLPQSKEPWGDGEPPTA